MLAASTSWSAASGNGRRRRLRPAGLVIARPRASRTRTKLVSATNIPDLDCKLRSVRALPADELQYLKCIREESAGRSLRTGDKPLIRGGACSAASVSNDSGLITVQS